ncbi:MAG: hypothetical protein AB6733_20680 [Clostridiaceae bacterium]
MFFDKLTYFMMYKISDKLKFYSIIALILSSVAFLCSVFVENSFVNLVAFPLSFIMNVVFIFNFIKEYRNYLKEDN